MLVGDVVLHAGVGVDFEFARVDWSAQTGMILACIFAFTIALWVVDMLGLSWYDSGSRSAVAGDMLGLSHVPEDSNPDVQE